MWVAENSVIHVDRSEKSVIHMDWTARPTQMTEFSNCTEDPMLLMNIEFWGSGFSPSKMVHEFGLL
jgi:hypothetical protein